MVVLHDVTDQRRTERRFRALIEKSTNTISVLDEAGRVRYASPSHERLLGYDPEALVGRSALDLVHPQDRERVRSRFRSVLRGSSDARMEFRIRHADGSWRTFAGTMDDQLDDPDVEGIIFSCHDVTERRGHEQRLQVLNRVLRHDVRNDVNVIDGYAELLSDRHDDPTTASYVDVIRGKTADLVSLSDKARQLDEALTREGGPEPVDLAALTRRRI
ncbi:PAS domain S-box protein, partial [Halobium palmae]